jgi:hypothetical protein
MACPRHGCGYNYLTWWSPKVPCKPSDGVANSRMKELIDLWL